MGLAFAGIAIGYGMGYLLKKDEPTVPRQVEVEHPKEPAKPVEAEDKSTAMTPEITAVLPEKHDGDATARAYEEALPKEIVEFPAIIVPAPVKRRQMPDPAVPDNGQGGATAPPVVVGPSAGRPEPQVLNNSLTGPVETRSQPAEPAGTKTEADKATVPELLTGWKKNALFVVLTDKPKIAIVIDDMGVDRRRSRIATELPGPLTLSYLTYARDLPGQTQQARQGGHELMLHVPMEPSSKDIDPGPNVLLSGLPKEEIQAALTWGLNQFDGYVGINNHMGSRFTSHLDGMKTVMEELRRRKLIFLDSVTSGSTTGQLAAHQIGVPFIARNIFLDHIDDIQEIRNRLNEVKRLARKRGYAVAIGHPRDATLKALGPWLQTVENDGFQLVPISALIRLASMADTTQVLTDKKESKSK